MEHAAVEARILSLFGAVAGVHAHGIELRPLPQARRGFTMGMSCWSPTLHRIEARMSHFLPAGADERPADIERAMRRILRGALLTQRHRAALGVAMGTATPQDPRLGISVMGHVLVDRGLLDIIHDRSVGGGAGMIAASISDLHRTTAYDGTETVQNDDCIEDGIFRSTVSLATGMLYDGRDLSVQGCQPPETMRAAVVGRRLGEVAEVPDAIAGHLIERWGDDEHEADWTVIRVRPHHIRLDADERTWGGRS